MQEIKYQPLKYTDDNDDEPVIQEYNLAQRNNRCFYLQECKRHWLIKVLLMCFIVVKTFYVINNFESIISWLQSHNETGTKNYNRTDIIFENSTRLLHGDESVTTIYDIFRKKNNILTSDRSHVKNFNNNAITNDTNTTNKITIDAVVATTKKLMITPLSKTPATSIKKYFINTSQCHIPFVDPFTPEIRKMFKPQHSTGCTIDQPIITVAFNEHDGYYNLHINYTVAKGLMKRVKNNITIEDDVLCCYQQIVRSGSGSKVDERFK